jgi:hypothetical protein
MLLTEDCQRDNFRISHCKQIRFCTWEAEAEGSQI